MGVGPRCACSVLIQFGGSSEPAWKGYLYALLMAVASVAVNLLYSQVYYFSSFLGLRIKTTLIACLYRKVLTAWSTGGEQRSAGEVINSITLDTDKVYQAVLFAGDLLGAPLRLLITMVMLWQYLGPSCLVAVAVVVIVLFISYFFARRVQLVQTIQMEKKDKRVKYVHELFNGIKILKLYAWEEPFQQRVSDVRRNEVELLQKMAVYFSLMNFVWNCISFLVSLVTFMTFLMVGSHRLDPVTAFVSLALFNTLRFSLLLIPDLIVGAVVCKVAMRRIKEFMQSEDVDPKQVGSEPDQGDAVTMRQASFSWHREQRLVLRDVDLHIPQGHLVAVVGHVGCGKTSFLSAILGELRCVKGSLDRKGKVAYVAQQAWIQNATVRQNILLKRQHHSCFYERVVQSCQLQTDLAELPAGDQTELLSSVWISNWSEEVLQEGATNSTTAANGWRLTIYGLLGICQGTCIFFGTLILGLCGLAASSSLHDETLSRLVRAPMSFFDTTPLGRMLNRFSYDGAQSDEIEVCLGNRFPDLRFAGTTTKLVIFYVHGLPRSLSWRRLPQKLFVRTFRQLQRLESVSRSPVFNCIAETVPGVQTIRAYAVQRAFIALSDTLLERWISSAFHLMAAERWLTVRLNFLGTAVSLFTACLLVHGRDVFGPAAYGLTLLYALKAPWRVSPAPSPDWPQHGAINFVNFSTRYRPDLDFVLHNINLDVQPSEKVGLVGRTGSGKSTLTLSMFRIVEAVEGDIMIDDVAISRIGLHDLRSKLTIIPQHDVWTTTRPAVFIVSHLDGLFMQDPVLFCGSLRLNLDPKGEHTDDEVWAALDKAHLKAFFQNKADKLHFHIEEDGQNLSVGQHQLICLARALLRNTKLLVLDEATASVDPDTDALVQQTIRRDFAHCTVLTVAHRLQTILDANRRAHPHLCRASILFKYPYAVFNETFEVQTPHDDAGKVNCANRLRHKKGVQVSLKRLDTAPGAAVIKGALEGVKMEFDGRKGGVAASLISGQVNHAT
ncbi:hypothetical protein V5799_014755 [Amblyomma americanum]|uniref:Uncharacterized protein n=1 Tax=Amblyomma americanum TaxID=6943 RepID=A0AAQ4E240_AMBAM